MSRGGSRVGNSAHLLDTCERPGELLALPAKERQQSSVSTGLMEVSRFHPGWTAASLLILPTNWFASNDLIATGPCLKRRGSVIQ